MTCTHRYLSAIVVTRAWAPVTVHGDELTIDWDHATYHRHATTIAALTCDDCGQALAHDGLDPV